MNARPEVENPDKHDPTKGQISFDLDNVESAIPTAEHYKDWDPKEVLDAINERDPWGDLGGLPVKDVVEPPTAPEQEAESEGPVKHMDAATAEKYKTLSDPNYWKNLSTKQRKKARLAVLSEIRKLDLQYDELVADGVELTVDHKIVVLENAWQKVLELSE